MTQISRPELVDKLETVAPALAVHNLVPQMTHFWFTGKTVMAYNDQIAIAMPLKTDFRGAVPGGILLDLLKSSLAKTVDLVAEGNTLLIKAGKRSNFKLGMLPPEVFIFQMPVEQLVTHDLSVFVGSVEDCMRSLGSDTSIPEQLGVTVVPNGKAVDIYATNNSTISAAKLKSIGSIFSRRVILSTPFCKQMISISKRDKEAELAMIVAKDHVLMRAGEVSLFGRLIESERPFDFDKVIEHHFPAKDHSKLIPFPKGLKHALDRAVIITDAKVDQALTKVQVAEGYAKLFSSSDRGEVTDKLKLDSDHEDIKISVNPKLLLQGVDAFDKLVITDRCVVMTNTDGAQYLVSASVSPK